MKKFIGQALVQLNFYRHQALWFFNWSIRARFKGWLFYIPLLFPHCWRCSRCGQIFPRDRPNTIAKHLFGECPNPPTPPPGQTQTRYTISEDGESITCFVCGATSYNPGDVEHKYCGNCHEYHEDAGGGMPKI